MSLIEKAKQRFASRAEVESNLRNDIQEIVRAYRHSWDIYSELIQNSIDAINRRHMLLNDPESFLYTDLGKESIEINTAPDYRGRIKLRIDIPANTITIYDNGVGIPANRVEDFLLPKGGDKVLGRDYGFKGFGLTFVAFISEEFSITSRYFASDDNRANKLALDGLFTWLADETKAVPFPTTPIQDVIQTEDDMGEWNTVIRVKLAENYVGRFSAVSAAGKAVALANCGWADGGEKHEKPEGFLYLLRTKTAIGNTRPLFSIPPTVVVECELEVVTSNNETISGIEVPYSYYHPKDHDEVSIDAHDFASYYESHKLAGASRTFRGLYHTITDVDVGVVKKRGLNVTLPWLQFLQRAFLMLNLPSVLTRSTQVM